MYRLFAPTPLLRPYIENYWLLRSAAPSDQPVKEVIFVDGKADILFNFGVPYKRLVGNGGAASITVSNVDGQRTQPVEILQTGVIDLIGVRFYPGGLSAFTPLPIHHLSNEVVEVTLLFGNPVRLLEAQLYDACQSPQKQIELLNQFFTARLQTRGIYPLVQAIAAQVAQQDRASIRSLSDQFGYSIRSVDRFFQQTMGFSPKTYLKIARLHKALAWLSTDTPLSDIAFNAGYYDQAHFAREFRTFTGHTPSLYRAMLFQRRADAPPNLVQFVQEILPPAR